MKKTYSSILAVLIIIILWGCYKDNVLGEDPYAGGKQPFGVNFLNVQPSPQSGPAGSEVTFYVKGAKPYEDSIRFLLNGESVQILEVADSSIKIKVPDNVSSGIASIVLGGQIFFGPRFKVIGNISIDEGFLYSIGSQGLNGSPGTIFEAVPTSSGYFLAGSFVRFQNSDYTNLATIDRLGASIAMLNRDRRPNGPVYSAKALNNDFLISGSFDAYRVNSSLSRLDIGNITRLKSDGSISDTIIDVINITPENPRNGKDTVPIFNGGSPFVPIQKSFVTADGNVIAIGNFHNYSRVIYERSTRLSRQFVLSAIHSIMKMDSHGKLDSTYNFSLTGNRTGANGTIKDAVLLSDGSVIVVGDFTQWDNTDAKHIVKINPNGDIDTGFDVGSSTEGSINLITYNAQQQRLMLVGRFNSFNGETTNGVVMLKENGQVDEDFRLGNLTGGVASFAQVLNNGNVLITGTFSKYDDVTRAGFLLLRNDGSAPQAFNVPGSFQGQVRQVIEASSSLGNPALILIGDITMFDDEPVGGIIKIEVKP